MKKLEEEVQKEVEDGSFAKKIKTNCAWCSEKIPGTIDYYCDYGNACVVCSGRFSRVVAGVRGVRINKKGKKTEYKIRDYTREEIDEMLMDRIAEVKALKNEYPRYLNPLIKLSAN